MESGEVKQNALIDRNLLFDEVFLTAFSLLLLLLRSLDRDLSMLTKMKSKY